MVVGRAAKDAGRLAPEKVAQLVKRDMGTDAEYTYPGRAAHPGDGLRADPAGAGPDRRRAHRRAGPRRGDHRPGLLRAGRAGGDSAGRADRRAQRARRADRAGCGRLALPGGGRLRPAWRRSTILVYDLGGGTFDTTVIRLDGDDISVVCTDGDHRLGGADWDKALAAYLLDQFESEHPGLEPRADPAFMQDLHISAEQLKKDLSATQARRYIMRFGGAVTRVELTRAKFEELTADLLDRTIEVTERAVDQAKAQGIDHFDDVLLVGGSSKMPAVARALKERLGLSARLYEPDLAVAKGAARFALLRTVRPDGQTRPGRAEQVAAQTGMTVPEVERLASKRVSTVISRGFGTRSIDGSDPLAWIDPVHARQMVSTCCLPTPRCPPTPVPTPSTPPSTTSGWCRSKSGNRPVRRLDRPGREPEDRPRACSATCRPKLPAMSPIEVTFFMSETGLLSVHATAPGSGPR